MALSIEFENGQITPYKEPQPSNISYKLYRAVEEINTTDHSYKELLDNLMRTIATNTHSEYVGMCIVEEGDHLQQHSYYCKDEQFLKGGIDEENLINRAIHIRKIIISNNVKKDSRLTKKLPKIKKMLAIPIGEIGQLLLLNRKDDYTVKIIDRIFPLLNTIKSLSVEYKRTWNNNVEELKHSFLATMSHEIRTPLFGVVGMISLLQDSGPLTENQSDYVTRALRCCSQLTEIITDILDYSKMKSGNFTLLDEPFDLKECIESALTIVSPRSIMKNIDLKYKISKKLPKKIYGDCKRLRQILINVIGNAVKFTNEGSVKVDVSLKREEGYHSIIEFVVEDTGIGIDLKDQERIFDVFHQVANTNDIKRGTGLGLAICKELVTMMHGTIKVSSEGLHKGSTFTFTIQVQSEAQSESRRNSCEKETKGLKILVVDDLLDNRMVLSGYLHNWGIESYLCSSAEECLHELRLGKKFDIAMIDVCMPRMSGIELAQTIRKEFSGLPMIALSSKDVGPQGRMWFDVFMNKPYTRNALYDNILKLLSNKSNGKSQAISTLESLKILVVEDESNHQFMIKEMLKFIGIKEENLFLANNGEVAVKIVKENNIDLCFMDLIMPVMDGFSTIEAFQTIPDAPIVVALSASILESDKKRCQTLGVDGFLTKPVLKQDLLTVIKRYIKSDS